MTGQVSSIKEVVILRVYIKSESKTIQAADMDTIGHPLCTQTRSPADKLGMSGYLLPHDQQILLDASIRAAKSLDIPLEIIDASDYGLLKRFKSKEVIPRIEIGDLVIVGLPTSEEIVAAAKQSMTVLD